MRCNTAYRWSKRYDDSWLWPSILIFTNDPVKATDALSVMPPRHASTTCLPYSLFDQLIVAATEKDAPIKQKQLAEALRNDLAARLSKLQKWSGPR